MKRWLERDFILVLSLGILIGLLIPILIFNLKEALKEEECFCDVPAFTDPCSIWNKDARDKETYDYCEARNWTFLTQEESEKIIESYKLKYCECYAKLALLNKS
ncbi:hypothetical protein J4225_01300 [Candidatus Pacearchaeota archaeon]|nr:hypothetical protein [Candidatus Pacearchaeota archaeon]